MREQLRDHSRLLHILQAIDNIMRFTEGKIFLCSLLNLRLAGNL